MATDVIVPPLGTTVDTLTLIAWYKQEGDAVLKDEPLFVVETDKATLDVEAPASGKLHSLSAQAGDSVTALSRIAVISAEGEVIKPPTPNLSPKQAPTTKAEAPKPTPPPPPKPTSLKRIFISPRAKRLAESRQVVWQSLKGTGPEGAIVERDVNVYLERPAFTPTLLPVTLTTEAEVTELVALKERLQTMGAGVSYEALWMLLLVRALKGYPKMNATLERDTVTHWEPIHLGITVEEGDDLRLAVLPNTDKQSLKTVLQALELMPTDSPEKPTFAITNLGELGIDSFTPVVAMPNCPLLGIGRIKPQNGGNYSVWLSLTFDPRLVGSGLAARFLNSFAKSLQNPLFALL